MNTNMSHHKAKFATCSQSQSPTKITHTKSVSLVLNSVQLSWSLVGGEQISTVDQLGIQMRTSLWKMMASPVCCSVQQNDVTCASTMLHILQQADVGQNHWRMFRKIPLGFLIGKYFPSQWPWCTWTAAYSQKMSWGSKRNIEYVFLCLNDNIFWVLRLVWVFTETLKCAEEKQTAFPDI